MKTIIDTSTNTTSRTKALKEAGIETVIRYYCTDTQHEKCLKLDEAEALSEAEIRIGIVFQDRQNEVECFNQEKGYAAGKKAYKYADNTMGQPLGSVISFAVDFNPTEEEVNKYVIPYFEGVQQAFSEEKNNGVDYQIGAYGSGLVCNTLWNKGLCTYRWLSNSHAYNGTKIALENGEYELEQLYNTHSEIDGLSVDYNTVNPNLSGTFLIESFPTTTGSGIYEVSVSQNSFLHLRAASNIDSETIVHLKKDQRVLVVDVVGKWAYVKVKIKGELYHGFCEFEYLSKVE